MADTPTFVEIRSYQVGFGDCFLLSFGYGARRATRHVLVDFGTTALPAKKPKAGETGRHMLRVAQHIAGVCGKDGLTGVVATHRHADHISGFGTDGKTGRSGDLIRGLEPKLVLQPWTEDPDARRNARTATRTSSRSPKSVVRSLDAMHLVAAQIASIASRAPRWMSLDLRRELQFLGTDNIANRSAVENLIAMGQRKGATAVWAHHGSKSGFERLLPGVKVRVLGPPTLEQTEKIKKMRSRDPDQFWHLLDAAALRLRDAGAALDDGHEGGAAPANGTPVEARWFRAKLERLSGEQLLEIVRTLDQQMNNTSLILLFEVFGRKLLFPGDAQIENWSYALEDAPDAKRTRTLLEGVDVYKVGHHGSLNATPKKALWARFSKRTGKQLHTMLSTMPGKHGNTKRGTEVPRRTLRQALEKESHLHNTENLPYGAKHPLCHGIRVTRTRITPL